MTSVLRGVLPVFQTPFDDDEEVDYVALERELTWIIDQGAHGLVFGMVSEALRLTDRERGRVVRAAAAVAGAASVPLVVSVGAESTRAALDRLDDAIASGAAAVMATPPLTNAVNEEQLEAYFRALLVRSPIPVVVQDASSYVGQPLSVDLQARLHQEFGDRALFKPEAVPIVPTLAALLRATGGGATVFEGMGGGALLESYPEGVSGSMPGAEVAWAVVAMWDALEAGDRARAQRIDVPLRRMLALQTDLDSFVACEKFLLHRQGVLRGQASRGPSAYTLTRDVARQLVVLLDELAAEAGLDRAAGVTR